MNDFEKYRSELSEYFRLNNFVISEKALNLLAEYAILLTERNVTVNLISRKDIENVVENHIFISAFISKYLPKEITSILDIGTGGGLPGIPLAIVMQFSRVSLVDSTKKKYFAVRDFIQKLDLKNVSAFNERVESNAFREKFSGGFSATISRATVKLVKLLEYSLPLLKKKGFVISLKGGDISEEIKEAERKFKNKIKDLNVFQLSYKPNNLKNEKEKELIIIKIEK